MSTKSTLVRFMHDGNGTSIPGEIGGLCYTGALLAQAGAEPVNGVVYRITVEAVGAEAGHAPELWMLASNDALRVDEIAREARRSGNLCQRTRVRKLRAELRLAKKLLRTHRAAYRRMLRVKTFSQGVTP